MSFKQFGGIKKYGNANEIKTNKIISDFSYSDESIVNSSLTVNENLTVNGNLKVDSKPSSEFEPLDTSEGGIIAYNTTIDELMIWDGNQWKVVGEDVSFNTQSYWELNPLDNSIEYNQGDVIVGDNEHTHSLITKQRSDTTNTGNFYTPSNFNLHNHDINIKKYTSSNAVTSELLMGGHYYFGQDSTTYIQSRDKTYDVLGTNPQLSYGRDLLLNPLGGNIGVGVVGTGATLDISGNIRTNTELVLKSVGDGNDSGYIKVNQNNIMEYENIRGNGGHTFITNTGSEFIYPMFIKNTGEVGIGTTQPVRTLDVDGTIRSREDIEFINPSGTQAWGRMTASSGSFFIESGAPGSNQDSVCFSAWDSGTPIVNIRTKTDDQTAYFNITKNSVDNSSYKVKFQLTDLSGNGSNLFIDKPTGTTMTVLANDSGGGLGLHAATGSYLPTTPHLFIQNNGNVGIDTKTPSSKLDVNGEINVNTNNIKNVKDPVNAQDAATKNYVDSKILSINANIISGVSNMKFNDDWSNTTMNTGTVINSFSTPISGVYKINLEFVIFGSDVGSETDIPTDTTNTTLELSIYDTSIGYEDNNLDLTKIFINGNSFYQGVISYTDIIKQYPCGTIYANLNQNQSYNICYKYKGSKKPILSNNATLNTYFTLFS